MVSCVILTHNNEDSIEALLENVSFCDEQVVINDQSTDRTCEIAKNRGALVVNRKLNDDFASQRNAGLAKATGDWILFVDSDERVSDPLKKDIQSAVTKNDGTNGYYMFRKDILFGRELRYGETANIRLLRLAKRGVGKWKREVHEIWEVNGEVKTFTTPLLHSPHPTVRSFLTQIDRYTTINAAVFFKEGKRSNWSAIVIYPMAKFFQDYILKLGFLDGTAGFVVAMMMSFHSFLTRAKLWQLQQKDSH